MILNDFTKCNDLVEFQNFHTSKIFNFMVHIVEHQNQYKHQYQNLY
jgi:hypothetical protein